MPCSLRNCLGVNQADKSASQSGSSTRTIYFLLPKVKGHFNNIQCSHIPLLLSFLNLFQPPSQAMSDLQIKQIDVFQVDLPYLGGVYHLSRGREYTSFDATIVRSTTQNGIEGWGESTPFGSTFVATHALGVRSGIARIAPKLIGLDPRRVDRINEVMDAALVGHEHAKAALDIACWDIFGKSVGLPVCELLGGRTELALPVISSIHVGEPEEMRARVAQYRELGILGHSIKVSGEPVSDSARIQASLADKKPGEFFIVDANCGFTVETALRMLDFSQTGWTCHLRSALRHVSRMCLSSLQNKYPNSYR